MSAPRTMYMLTLDGKPVVVAWESRIKPVYYLASETPFPVWLYKSIRTVQRHVRMAQHWRHNPGRYGYVAVQVPS